MIFFKFIIPAARETSRLTIGPRSDLARRAVVNVLRVLLAMRMRMRRLDRDDVGLSVAHTAFSHQALRKPHDGICLASQNHRFETILVVQMHMHGGNRQIVMIMLDRRKPLSKFSGVMVV